MYKNFIPKNGMEKNKLLSTFLSNQTYFLTVCTALKRFNIVSTTAAATTTTITTTTVSIIHMLYEGFFMTVSSVTLSGHVVLRFILREC